MNGYDFDKTIYNGDSTADFCIFCFKKYPALFRFLPMIGWYALLWKLGIKTKTQFKEHLYHFFRGIKDIDAELEIFWSKNFCNIKEWYIAQKKADDVIISASPEFLLRPAIEKLSITNLIASRVDKKTGAYTGENCWGQEKVFRFQTEFPNKTIEHFYSDSRSDTPIARLATDTCYLVKGNQLIPWDI